MILSKLCSSLESVNVSSPGRTIYTNTDAHIDPAPSIHMSGDSYVPIRRSYSNALANTHNSTDSNSDTDEHSDAYTLHRASLQVTP